MRAWLRDEVRRVMKLAELQIKDATDFATAYATGEISPDEAEARMARYYGRWGEHPLIAATPREETTNQEVPFSDGGFDAALSYGVFLYFKDLAYASTVLQEMLRVVHPAAPVLILDVPDASKRGACEEARRVAGAALYPPHFYYPKPFFGEFAASRGRHAKIEDQAVPGYANSRFRYNVLL